MRNRGTSTAAKQGLLTRLRNSNAGNTAVMAAVALIPLAGMAGSGLDMSRSYLVKSRLQAACDAGSLATRKSMTSSTVIDTNAETQGQNFFYNNFPTTTYGVTGLTFTTSLDTDNQVLGRATATVPMTLMKMFGFNQVALVANCKAMLEVSNTDVMMVLDVTGSMAYDPSGDNNIGNGPGSKIDALRDATEDFFDTINNATSSDARFRIGFVPYSQGVNMGTDPFDDQPLIPSTWLVDSWTYQAKLAQMDNPGWTGTSSFGSYTEQTFGSNISNSNCNRYGTNTAFSQSNGSITYTPDPSMDATVDNSNPGNVQPAATLYSDTQPTDVRRVYERVSSGWSSGNKQCKRRWRVATTTYVSNGRFGFRSWDYQPVTYNVTSYKAGTPISAYTAKTPPTGSVTTAGTYNMIEILTAPGSTVVGSSTVYDGCIEERSGIAQADFTTMPAGAWDLDVNTTPYDNATKWRPMWPEMVWQRGTPSPVLDTTTDYDMAGAVCPAPASHLAVRTAADVTEYVDALYPTGGTYHDFGMAWGVRMLSANGMFASRNTTAPNGKAISRHLIFMTDGKLEPQTRYYSAQGYEPSDRRVMGSTSPVGGNGNNMEQRHSSRFQALCNAARAQNISVWTVAFGDQNPATLVSCADPGNAYVATNAAALQSQFQAIASRISKLRLAQ
jgi:Flp pilus assembly protein TadG